MHCPFPGMDPFIERSSIWPDFHDRLIATISAALQLHLRPKYAALVQDRLYVVRSKRPIHPDVSIIKPRRPRRDANGGLAVLEMDKPLIFDVVEEEIRQPYLQIIETATGNALITAIEVLSPDNKLPGVGRKMYMKKRREVRQAGANLVEIDLLRAGRSTLRIPANELVAIPSWHYLVGVLRRPRRQEVYPIELRKRLPVIGIPLGRADADVPLDLQAAFSRVWEEGPYPELLGYEGPPPGELTPDEIKWCGQKLRQAGIRK